MKKRAQKIQVVVLMLLLIFATAFSPLVGDDQRNYLVIYSAVLVLPMVFFLRFRFGNDLIWIFVALLLPFFVTLFYGHLEDFSTIAYTGLLAAVYLIISEGLRSGFVVREKILLLLKVIIQLYALFSVLQMIASFTGLPVPNLMLSHGLWSYNSLAVEPSHAGRALALSMLAYLIISRDQDNKSDPIDILKKEKSVLILFFISMMLTGSATAFMAAVLTIILALSKKHMLLVAFLLMFFWPMLYLVDLPSLQRSIGFLSALPTMDISALAEADQSGALRVLPLLIFLEKADFTDLEVWFGGGLSTIATYVQGELIGAGDLVAAGFIPGYIIAFGLIGTLLFLWVFLIRFLVKPVLPIGMLWIFLFATSAWNTQLFWYGLMLVRVVYYFQYAQKKRERKSLLKVNGVALNFQNYEQSHK